MTPRRNACELEIDLFCNGLRIDPSCSLEADARKVSRTRAGLGSGLELVVPGGRKDLWLNVPVEEDFARRSPYALLRAGHDYLVHDTRNGERYAVRIPEEPAWYARRTARGTEMSRVGVLQGTYLGIYISNSCLFWYSNPAQNCRFCTTGSNVGVNEVAEKHLDDVIEVARAAKAESGVTFVHFNSGYQSGRDLALAAPYVKAVKEEVGALVGVQLFPTRDLEQYDRMIEVGADHFSFCYEFHNPEYFARYLPGKQRAAGQETFFRALEYTAKRLGKGAVSGEIIAGVEPIEDTIRAIDYITSVGAFPTVCIFRPVVGSEMERHTSPKYEEMRAVFAHVYEACRRNGIPIGAAPNIEVSLIVQPDDARELARPGLDTWLYDRRLKAVRTAARPLFAWKSRRRRVPAAAYDALVRSKNGSEEARAAEEPAAAAAGAPPAAAAAPSSIANGSAAGTAGGTRWCQRAEREHGRPDPYGWIGFHRDLLCEQRHGVASPLPSAECDTRKSCSRSKRL
ncbi:MAG TPA: radical SAM protein, partial [Acidobacteriota bacterium]|nr:radical SAM protein [Acidobacteriota bacterium]